MARRDQAVLDAELLAQPVEHVRAAGFLFLAAGGVAVGELTAVVGQKLDDLDGTGLVDLGEEVDTAAVGLVDLEPRKPGQARRLIVNRMIVSMGADGNCIRRYLVLDFTGPKPFVSKPFAYNPDDDICEHLKHVRWRKKETAIDLAGPQRYLYRSYRDVIGPIDD